MDTKKAIFIYQYSERIKSGLIIAFLLLERMAALEGEELRGAEKLMLSYLEALLNEVRIAQNVEKSSQLTEAEKKISEAIGKLHQLDYSGIRNFLREAMTKATTSGQIAMEALEDRNLL